MNESMNRKRYLSIVDKSIRTILSRHQQSKISYDILNTQKTSSSMDVVLKVKQRQMKIGEIWQEVLGNYDGFINLKTGHESGLDIISHNKKIVIELKNRTNTDNASSRKTNFDKLSKFKKKNPEYRCIYGNINATTRYKTFNTGTKYILHNNVEIEHQVGYTFLKSVLQNDTEFIIDFVKATIDKYS